MVVHRLALVPHGYLAVWMARGMPRSQSLRDLFSLLSQTTALQPQLLAPTCSLQGRALGTLMSRELRNWSILSCMLQTRLDFCWKWKQMDPQPSGDFQPQARSQKCFFCLLTSQAARSALSQNETPRLPLFSSLATAAVRVGRIGQRPWSSQHLHWHTTGIGGTDRSL